MNKMEAYSKLFSTDDNELDKKYYIRLLSKSENDVPQEVLDYLESFESVSDESDEIEVVVDNNDVVLPEENDDSESIEVVEDTSDEVVIEEDIPIVTEVQFDSDMITVEEQSDEKDSITELQMPVIEVEDQVEEVIDSGIPEITIEPNEELSEEVNPIGILKDFYDHLKKASVYRKIRNSDNPDNLCKSVSSFCTRYLIELHSSGFDSDDVRSAVSERINVGDILRLLADYVEYGDLNSLAKSVVVIRNFLDKLDKEFEETDN